MTTPSDTDHMRIILFDLGGVVVRICRGWEEACQRAGVPIRPNPVDQQRESERKRTVQAYQTGRMSCDAYWSAIAATTADVYSPPEIERIHKAWTGEDYPGIEVLIERLNQTPGVRTACLSNTNPSHWAILTCGDDHQPASRAVARLARRLVSHELGRIKPDPRIYAQAEHLLGAHAGDIVFFDDTPENIDAARKRRWNAHLIDPAADTTAQIEHILDELSVFDGI